jgi:hypothetical protein
MAQSKIQGRQVVFPSTPINQFLAGPSAGSATDAQFRSLVLEDHFGIKGFISGLGLEWISATQIRVKTGIAHIESTNQLHALTSAVTITPSTSASTWYYVYLFISGGSVTADYSTTAPGSAYFGDARSMSTNTSRRFIGFFRTGTSGQIFNFEHNPLSGGYDYQEDYSSAAQGFRIIGPGQATTFTTVSAANIVPPFATTALMRCQNYNGGTGNTTSNLFITIPADTGTNRLIVNPGADSSYEIVLDTSQQISYKLGAAGATGIGGAYIDVKKIIMKR